MPAMQLQTYMGTAINTTLAPLAAVSGDSLSVSNFAIGKVASLIQIWADVQVAGTLRVRSPKFHDNVNGIRIDTIISDPQPLMPWGVMQPLYPNDTLIVELAGSSVAGDVESVVLLEYFDEMPGVQSRLMDWATVRGRIDQFLTVENTIATGTAGGYSGAEAINVEIDQFQQGADYAILGYKVDVEAAAIGWRAVDFGNLRVGGPGEEVHLQFYSDWFIRLSNTYGKPMIPVFNGSNKSSVLVDAVQDENGADPTVTTYLARLRQG